MVTKKTVVHGGLIIEAVLPGSVGDLPLTINPTTKEVGTGTPIDTSTFLTKSLQSSYVIIGDSSNEAQPRSISGAFSINNLGVATLNPGIVRAKLNAGSPNRVVVNDSLGVMVDAAAITPNRVIVSDANGIPIASSVTTTAFAFFDPTSSIQTQLNSKLTVSLTSVAQGDSLQHNGTNWVNIPIGTAGQVPVSNGTSWAWGSPTANGLPSGGTTNQYLRKIDATNYNTEWHTFVLADVSNVSATSTELNLLSGLTVPASKINFLSTTTSDVQTQINLKLSTSLSYNSLFVGNASNTAGQLAAGAENQVLQIIGGSPVWQTFTPGTGSVTSIDVSGGTTGLTTSGGPVTTTGTITLSGTLTTVNGGTGLTSYTTGDVLYASASNVLSKRAAGTNGYVFTMSGGVPVWAAPTGGGGGTWGSITGTLSAQTDLQSALDLKSNLYLTHNTQTGDYVLVLTDKNSTIVEMDVTIANTITVPENSSVAFPIGTQIPIVQYNSGLTTIVPDGVVVINSSSGSLDSHGQYAPMVLEKRATDEWYLWNGSVGGGTVTSVSGTTNRITSTGGTTPVIDISASYVGQASITTVGTLTSGATGSGFTIALGSSTVTGDLSFSNLQQITGLSILGVTGTSTADVAAITGTANQILRVNGAGTSLAFGSIDLSQSATVGSSILSVANGGTGASTFPGWSNSGSTTIISNTTQAGAFTNTFALNGVINTQNALSSSWIPAQRINIGAHTGLTASTEFHSIYIPAFSWQWATGAIALQRFHRLEAPTLTAIAASSVTITSTLDVAEPLAGTNISINSKTASSGSFAISANGGIRVYNPSFTKHGAFYQAANDTTVIIGGTSGENIVFGPSNRVFVNVGILVPTAGFQSSGIESATNTSVRTSPTFTASSGSSSPSLFSVSGVTLTTSGTYSGTIRGYDFSAVTSLSLNSGTLNPFNFSTSIAANSGTNVIEGFTYKPVLNYSGTHSGVSRGFVYNPTESGLTGEVQYAFLNYSQNANSGFGTGTPTAMLHVVGTTKLEGSLTLPVAGNGILIKEGTNATMGSVTLVGGTAVVNTTKVTANSRIFLTAQNLGTITIPAAHAISARTAGTSFTILSSDLTDTSLIAWQIIEPAP